MVNFLIRYNRKSGETMVDTYPGPAGRAAAIRERLRLEAAASDDSDIEVVVIAAESQHDLERTHARYFERAGGFSDVERGVSDLRASVPAEGAGS